MSASRGSTCEKAGCNRTSSNVSPSPKNLEELDDLEAEEEDDLEAEEDKDLGRGEEDDLGEDDLEAGVFILAMCKDSAGGRFGPNFCKTPGGQGFHRAAN
jgi:hypothetical protein